MDKKASLTKNKKAQIAILHKKGFSQRKICKKVCYNETAVYQAIAKFQNFGLYFFKGTDVHRTTVSRHLVYDFNLKAFKSAKKLRRGWLFPSDMKL